MLKYKHIIFDFDGTLSDSYPTFVKAMRTVMSGYGIEKTDEEIYYLLKKYSTSYVFNNCFEGDRAKIKQEFDSLADGLLRTEATPIEGAEEILKYIVDNGGKCYMYSHSGEIVRENVRRWGLEGYFTDYQLGEKEFPRKPAPDALLNLIKKQELDPRECVMVGDRDIDVLAGRNAGMAGILMDVENYYSDLDVEHRIDKLTDIKDILKGAL